MNSKDKQVIKEGELLATKILLNERINNLEEKKIKCRKHGNSKVYLELFDLDRIVFLLKKYRDALCTKDDGGQNE